MKKLLVTLISDQTIPNVQFIKEKQDEDTYFLFVSTQEMEKKGIKHWIINVCKIPDNKIIKTMVVDQFSLNDIESKLNELNYEEYEKLIVNITGGTKIMLLAVTEFFRNFLVSEIFYLTGIKDTILQVHPQIKQPKQHINKQITLDEYILSYGFEIQESKLSDIPFEFTKQFFASFISEGKKYLLTFKELRRLRNEKKKKKKYEITTIGGLDTFLHTIDYPLPDCFQKEITCQEIKYLTGGWFEEYIFYRLIHDPDNISENNIKTGTTLRKDNTLNEFDVIFLYKGDLYTIECKTSIINAKDDNEKRDDEKDNLMLDTIYKVTALQKNLGLKSRSSIFTLSSKEDNEVKISHFERGDIFNISILCREDLIDPTTSIAQLLNIK
ncbi:hypothetical protein EZS27_010514 [termite gut metagenome]|uniref:DUF1887 family protein n=1 Tax=termite gut metagenome TaxID=433724 RepID=A0A5J4S8H7_9ZZZZ